MELRQLKYFLAVAEESSFTRAARRLFVAQSTLSEQIQSLERSLGVTLFERDSRRVWLTAHGEQLVDPARRLLADADAAKSALLLAREPEQGDTLRLGIVCHPPPQAVRHLVDELRHQYPSIRVHLMSVSLTEFQPALHDGTVDALVMIPRQDEVFDCRTLARADLLAAMRWDNPLAEGESVSLEDFMESPMSRPHPNVPREFRDYWWLTNLRGGIEPRYVGDPAGTCTMLQDAVLYQGAVMLVPECLIEPGDSGGLVIYRRVAEPADARSWWPPDTMTIDRSSPLCTRVPTRSSGPRKRSTSPISKKPNVSIAANC